MGITKQSNALFLYMDVQENIPVAGSVETNIQDTGESVWGRDSY